MRVLEHSPALDQVDLVALERSRVGRLKPRHFAIDIGNQRRPMERRLGNGPAVALRVPEFLAEARGIDQELFRNAAANDAGAADPVFLRDHDARAVARGNPRGTHAARAGTDYEEIDALVRHAPLWSRSAGLPTQGRHCSPRFFNSSRIFAMTSSDNLFAQSCAKRMVASATLGCCSSSFLPAGLR